MGFSQLYKALFRPEAVIGDYSDNPTQLREEQERYERAVLDPLEYALESGIVEQTDGSGLLSDLCHINEAVYASTFELAAIRAGDDIKKVQGNLGHATAAFTLDIYGHVTDQMKQASAARMEDISQSAASSIARAVRMISRALCYIERAKC